MWTERKIHHDRLSGRTNTSTQQCYRQLDGSKTELEREARQVEDNIAEKTKGRWRRKWMHGQLPSGLDGKLVDIEQSYRWLTPGDIKGETESTRWFKYDRD